MSPLTDEDDTGEDFAFSLPDIGALIAGPLPSLGPDDLTFIANIDDLDKLHPDAGPSSSITSNGGFQTGAMLPSPRSSFSPRGPVRVHARVRAARTRRRIGRPRRAGAVVAEVVG